MLPEDMLTVRSAPFTSMTRFQKFVLDGHVTISHHPPKVVELWDNERAEPFEYPATVFSDKCTGIAPLSQSMNVSTVCIPLWRLSFDEAQCTGLKYLNISYYLHKYSIEKDGNRTVLAIEGTPETSRLIRWLYWNGTACINAVSRDDWYQWITEEGKIIQAAYTGPESDTSKCSTILGGTHIFHSCRIAGKHIDVIQLRKPLLGYEVGEVVRMADGTTGSFMVPSGVDCDEQFPVKFGVQVTTACRIKVSTCAQMAAQIQNLLHRWIDVAVYSVPGNTNETFTVATSSSNEWSFQKKGIDERCELPTTTMIQFAYTRFGSVRTYSHKLLSCKIELFKNIVDLTVYPYQHIYLSVSVYFIDDTTPPVQIFSRPPSIDIVLPPDFFYPFFTKA